MLTRFIFISILFCLGQRPIELNAQTPCACTNCPQVMPDNFTGSFLINIQNAANPTLGQNGQGVCGVSINFDHEYVGDLRITLTSPSGQTITLIGPIGLFGETDGSSWNIDFVPCADPASPDAGFSSTWSNNQPWGLGGTYTGSYYPATGCLENFNTGPVNGTWTLTVTDGQAADMGNFLGYEIIFCDPSSIDCFSCAANAGALPQPDVVNCEGNTALDLNLPPTWTPASSQPPASTYSYTYVISGPGGIILDYDPSSDLSTYPPGTYSVCGMSYLTSQAADIPQPNGVLTVNQLRNLLNGGTAPLCAKVGTNCVGVTIQPAPEDIEETVNLCGVGCYTFFGQVYCQSGTYVRALTLNGCPYSAVLNLTITPNTTALITETICQGECSANPNFPGECVAGNYQTVIENAAGCDSTIYLTLNVLNTIAVISNNPVIPCGGGAAQLQSQGSTVGGVSYTWSASNGGNILGPKTLSVANINSPGNYQLKVCKTMNGVTCCDSTEVTIMANTLTPNAPAPINGPITPCPGVPYSYTIFPVTGATSYTWSVPTGATINFGGTGVNANITWSAGAVGGDICVTANNGCGPSDPTCVTVTPGALAVSTIPQGPIAVCNGTTSTYTIPTIAGATSYNWTVTAPATISSGQGTNTIVINWNGGTTASICVAAVNACGTGPSQCLPVTITSTPAQPVLSGPLTACSGTTSTYTIAPVSGSTGYNWVVTGGTITSGGNGTTTAQVTWATNATSGSVCVAANNTCGTSASACQTVTLSAAPLAPTITGSIFQCAGITATYSIPPVTGSTGYSWTVPAGATILSGQNTTSISVQFSSAPGGDVCVSVNSGCGSSQPVCLNVQVAAIPNADAGINQSLCNTTATLSAATSIGVGTWTTLNGPGAATFSPPDAPSTSVSVTGNGVYSFLWTLNNQSCTDKDTVVVAFNAAPSAGVIVPLCDPANENYTISFPIIGGAAPYSIVGGTVAGTQFTSNPIVSSTNYTFTITDNNGCTSTPLVGSFNCNCTTSAGTMSQSLLQACEGQTVTAQHNANAVLDANDIGVFTLHQGSGTVLVNPILTNATGIFGFQAGMVYGQTYYVSYVVGNNLAGAPNPSDPCRSVAQGQPCIFYQIPTANAGADLSACGLAIPLVGTLSAGVGSWSVVSSPSNSNLNFTPTNAQNTTAVTDQFGIYTLAWTADNNGCSAVDQVQLSFNQSPTAGQISAPCNSTNTAYSVSFPISGSAPPYSVNGTSITGTNFMSALITSGTAYSFVITDANGCTSTPIAGNVNCNCSTDAGDMILNPLSACRGESITAQHVPGSENLDGDDLIAYVLHQGAGPTLLNPIATNATGVFTFQPGMVYGQQYYISFVVGNNLNGAVDITDNCLSVAQGQPAVFYDNPVANAGLDQAVCGQTLDLNASGNGQWSAIALPPGTNITFADASLQNTNVVVDTVGTFLLQWTVESNGCSKSDTMIATFNGLPAVANLVRDCDANNENYTVVLTLEGGTLPYTINGQVSPSPIFTSTSFPNGQGYSFSITDANNCPIPIITGNFACNCTTNAGTMGTTTLSACESDTITALPNNDLGLDPNDVVSFILHDGSGPTLGTIFSQNTNGKFVLQPGMTLGVTYYISRIAGNPLGSFPNPLDPCYAVAIGQPVVFLQNPSPNAGLNIEVCGTEAVLDATQSGFSGIWSLSPLNPTVTFSNSADNQATATVQTPGTYLFQWTESNQICSNTDEVEVRFNPLPEITAIDENCNSTNTQYSILVDVSNGTPPYTISGVNGTFTGSTFTSTFINTSVGYTLTATDSKGCTVGPISGDKNCNCATDAGSMVTQIQNICADDIANAVWNNDAALDGDDTLVYVLHTLAGSTLGQILNTSTTPSFAYTTGLQFNTTYYISAVAGSVVGGVLDLSDDCLSVAPGTPVRWKPLPTATLTGDATLCNGGATAVTFTGTGTFPLTITYNDGTNQNLTINNVQGSSLSVAPIQTTIYSLVSVTDGTLPACSTNLTDAVTVTVNQPVNAGEALIELDICAEEGTLVDLSTLLTGADTGGTWTEVSFNPSLTGTFDPTNATFLAIGQQPGKYEFRYKIDGIAPCPSDETIIVVNIRPQPVANAGEDVAINCTVLEVSLGDSGTTSGAGVTYEWSRDGQNVSNSKQFETETAGTYILLVSNAFGCTDSDEVLVSLNNDLPIADLVTVRDIRCYGERNGAIIIEQVSGGTDPYAYSLNDGPFTTTPSFTLLDDGIYKLVIVDANGCSSSKDSLVILEPEQVSVSLQTDLTPVRLGDTILIQAQTNIIPSLLDSVIWNPLMDTLGFGTLVQQFVPLEANQISVTVKDINGCTAKDQLQYRVDKRRRIYVPNIFDPLSSENNVVTVYGGNDVEKIEQFQIFDRWGEMVYNANDFLANDPTKGWQGDFRGKLVQPGVYIWKVFVLFKDGERELFSGDVTIFR